MTLIVVQRLEDKVTFSSDSRISFGNSSSYFDSGIKIFSVPFKLKVPAKTRADFNKYVCEYNYGLAVVGSSTNAYTVKDSITEILPNVTELTNMSNTSITGVGALVYRIYKEVSEELAPILTKNGLCEIILGGYCVVQKKIRILRFYPEIRQTKIDYKFEEIIKSDGIDFFGSGKKNAKAVYEADKTLMPLQIIKQVINSGLDKGVGGGMQSGVFYKELFRISGVLERIHDKDGKLIEEKKYVRGKEKEMKNLAINYPYLGISYGYTPVDIFLEK